MKNILIAITFIMLLGLAGRFDCESEIMTARQDEQNKQEFIKDLQMRCYERNSNDLDLCEGFRY